MQEVGEDYVHVDISLQLSNILRQKYMGSWTVLLVCLV